MAKKIVKQLKLQIPGGKAVPGQALGPALGQAGINIGEFVKKFNDATKEMMGDIVPTVIRVYEDRSYDMIYKTPPAAYLVKKAIGLETGSGTPNTTKVGKISRAQVKAIAEQKMADLNAKDITGAMKMIEGTCKSLGVEVVG